MDDVTRDSGRDIYRAQLEKELLELVDPKTGIVSLKYAAYINCPLCNADECEMLFTVKGYPHCRCKECGMVYVNPQVKQEMLTSLYSKQSKANEMWIEVLLSEYEQNTNFDLYDKMLQDLERLTTKRFQVDIGSSIGDFMLAGKRRGWNVEGVDLNERAVNHACQERNLNVRLGRLQDMDYDISSIPVIIATTVLEHVSNPREFIRHISSYLEPKGLILLQVPNIHSLANILLREKSPSFDGRNHLLAFSVETLSRLCKEEGLVVETYRTDIVASHLICKYIQYRDPCKAKLTFESLPPLLKPFFENNEKHDKFTQFIEELNMGQYINPAIKYENIFLKYVTIAA